KGTDVLVRAMAELVALGRRDVDLSIVGSGDRDTEMKGLAEELRLLGVVAFRGRRLHDEIPIWMSAADVFVLPSRREGCPNVVLEALASGRPVVASNVGGIPELVHDAAPSENGVLVEAGNPGQLARALASALDRIWDPAALRNSVESLSWNE